MRLGIGIDLGGTRIKTAAFDLESETVLSEADEPTRDGEREGGHPAWAAGVSRLVAHHEEVNGGKAEVVGLSIPGLAARDGSHIVSVPGKLHGMERFSWSEHLERDAKVLNDAHAALLGEVWQGAAKGLRDVAMLTLGTGVGGAILTDGRLMRGHLGRAGHLGHMSLDPDGELDGCGSPGSLELEVGNHTVPKRSDGKFPATKELVDAMLAGDAYAEELWARSMKALAAGIVTTINIADPEVVLIGGGIAAAGEEITRRVEAHMERFEWVVDGKRVPIRFAALDNLAGCYGAVYNALGRA